MTMVVIGLPITALAQNGTEVNARSFRGAHQIEVSFGLLSDLRVTTEATFGNVATRTEATGLVGSLAYGYGFAEEWALTVSLGLANADASTSVDGGGAFVESAAVIPLLFGVKFRPQGLAIGDALRPHAYAAVGPYFGLASDVRAGWTTGAESYAETAFGSRLGVGLELWLGRKFTLGLAAGYRLVSDFGRRIGSDVNHSSPEFGLSLGIVLGGGEE
jgi:hypothetical protein